MDWFVPQLNVFRLDLSKPYASDSVNKRNVKKDYTNKSNNNKKGKVSKMQQSFFFFFKQKPGSTGYGKSDRYT